MTYYDDIADGYEELHLGEQMKKMGKLLDAVKVKEDETLLDVGCGTGISTRCWRCRRTGIDPSEKLIAVAKEKDGAGDYIVGTAEKLPFKDGSFDVVISVTALHNMDNVQQALKEMKRVGKGRFAFSVLQKSGKFNCIMETILLNFAVKRIIKEEKDVIFIIS
ncbi:MAG: class I SAM-dependent methyltransferase [Nanoarchaeota archaeon]